MDKIEYMQVPSNDDIESLSDKDLKLLLQRVTKVCGAREKIKTLKRDLIDAQKDINEHGWTLANFDLGDIQGCNKYRLGAYVSEDYDDHCLLKTIDDEWYRCIVNTKDGKWLCFEPDGSKGAGETSNVYLYYKKNRTLPKVGKIIAVISPKGDVKHYQVYENKLHEYNHSTKKIKVTKAVTREQFKLDDLFFVEE